MQLVDGAAARIHKAFRPKTQRCYKRLFRNFVAFCVFMKINLCKVDVACILAFLKYLATQGVSIHMLSNYVSAIKAKFIVYDLNYAVADHRKVKYFLKSVRINRPLSIPNRHIMDLKTFKHLRSYCMIQFHVAFHVGFLGFLRLSNIAPHSALAFDPSRHITAGDVSFMSNFVKISLKWSKTMQDCGKLHTLSFPRVCASPLCPYKALKVLKCFKPQASDPIFYVYNTQGTCLLLDSRIRKVLSKLNEKMCFHKHYFTFHIFQRSGATLTFNSHVPIHKIKQHGSWTSECVWRYINQDIKQGEAIASTLASTLQVVRV